MIKLTLQNFGKRFQHQWIFKGIDFVLNENDKLLVNGFNGSGKSTFIQTLSGFQTLSEGKVEMEINDELIAPENFFKHISFTAPYVELPELFNPIELFHFLNSFGYKKIKYTENDFFDLIELSKSKNKPIKYFSSGMKQRLKLGLSFLCESPILILDEPTSNLDSVGIEWYQNLLNLHCKNRLVIVATNMPEVELSQYTQSVIMQNTKK
jgi:ABC-type multidrug transport system ATPase subunit